MHCPRTLTPLSLQVNTSLKEIARSAAWQSPLQRVFCGVSIDALPPNLARGNDDAEKNDTAGGGSVRPTQ